MTAAGAIVRKDTREFVRDGRALVALGIVALLSIAAFWLSAQRIESSERARTAAAQRDRRTWESQGQVNPHGAAHFSSWAFKPQTTLSVFEPGLSPYYGEAIWMEAHYQNPANHRPAEDATEARRFADLSPAWLTATLLPLLLIGLGFGSLAREREGGQWRQMAASGVSARSVLAGKARMLVGLGLAIALVFTVPSFFAGSALPAPGDAALRWMLILAAVLLFASALVAVVLAVSAACRTARAALLGLVGFWMMSVIMAPRLIASTAEVVAPAPSLPAFTEEIRAGLQAGIPPDQAPPALVKRLEDDTLERYGVRRLEDLPVNFEGILLQASEEHGNAVFDRQFGELRAAHQRQQRISRLAALVSPVVAFRNATAAFAGTDGAHHWHFAEAAEEHRRLTVRMLNDHLAKRAGGAINGLTYQADPALWATIPEFSYRAPSWTVSVAGLVDLAILGVWVTAGFAGARLAVGRWRSA